jgi:hypothetical protein
MATPATQCEDGAKALFRALDVRDDLLSHYRVTVRVFFGGIVIAIIGATISSIVLAIEGG